MRVGLLECPSGKSYLFIENRLNKFCYKGCLPGGLVVNEPVIVFVNFSQHVHVLFKVFKTVLTLFFEKLVKVPKDALFF